MQHLLLFGAVAAATWLLVIYLYPRLLLSVYRRALLVRGFGDGPVPVNTLYTQPKALFADPLSSLTAGSSSLMSRGTNRDTLYTVGWLDLSRGPLLLHVPEMAGRYYSVQFTDPATNTNFAYVGSRTTGTSLGDYLVVGPRSAAAAPGLPQIRAPHDSVMVIGRVFVENQRDLAVAYELAKAITLTPAPADA